jgi:elongator complex protein 3
MDYSIDERARRVRAAQQRWQRTRGLPLDLAAHEEALWGIVTMVRAADPFTERTLSLALNRYPRAGRSHFTKAQLVQAYRHFVAQGRLPFERETLRRLQMKPIRTASGVTPVAVLTRPAPCPGRCIFCPTDVRMPKSYLSDEPGAMRALQSDFDPYQQVASRIANLETIGHNTDKIELLILGGTWSAYPRTYQEWFIRRCFDALNEREAPSLDQALAWNEGAPHHNVGLVIETRPDWITPREIVRLRRLGVTKVQLGVQSLDDAILDLNRRGHTVEDTRRAVRLLRLGGFKIHLHWMPNLLGATPASDRADFARLWGDPALRPDELKIYPCMLVQDADLYAEWQRGTYRPYSEDELVELLVDCKAMTPPYCRINRVVRDIPATDIVAGSRSSNLRQIAQEMMRARGLRCHCIRCREVRGRAVASELRLETLTYATDVSEERFLSLTTDDDALAGFLRLSLPLPDIDPALQPEELRGAAVIREVHIYGPALGIGEDSLGEAQHRGGGARLVEEARRQAREAGYQRLAVIAAVGTRGYYRKLGFTLGELYMHHNL